MRRTDSALQAARIRLSTRVSIRTESEALAGRMREYRHPRTGVIVTASSISPSGTSLVVLW